MKNNELTLALSNCVRFLAIDSVERANSGHPGMPMGMADVATVLFNEFLQFNSQDPKWLNRDRFILSAGHGSMLLYSLLFLTGYKDISIEDLKNFRQLHAKCAGHPEFGHLEGIETTTGPLGQGVANAVGMALSEKLLAARLGENLINHKIYCIAGDGCLMEGISQEAISMAGNLGLNNLVLLWDNNSISIDGKTSIATCENMRLRFEACNWNVIEIDGHNFDEIRNALNSAQKSDKPIMISCKTTIGFGSPNKAGSEKSHGSPLGAEEILKVREKLNWPHAAFEIPQDLKNEWLKASKKSDETYAKWQIDFAASNSTDLNRVLNKELTKDFSQKIAEFKEKLIAEKPKQATRKSSQIALEFLTAELPELIGGSADLTESVLTKTSSTKAVSKENFSGRYIHYGVREHAMAAMMNGMSLHSNFIPYGGTFAVFSDYMKPAMRLSALMRQQVIYILTHDSIGLGEDGPTHQPIEHLAMLRGIPNFNTFRPADALETIECFEVALKNKETPSGMFLTRQNLPFLSSARKTNACEFGGYIASDVENPDVVIIASGSELSTAFETKEKLQAQKINARVVSMPCLDIFAAQNQSYQKEVLGDAKILKVAIEAGISQGWHQFIGSDGIFIGMSDFGASGKAEDLFKHFGITSDAACEKIISKLKNNH
jgi:transketolase